jgi:hypothetical protein
LLHPERFEYISRQLILTTVWTESETYGLEMSDKSRAQCSRNSTAFWSLVYISCQIRNGINSNLFFVQAANANKNRGIDSHRGRYVIVYAVSCSALEVKEQSVHHKRFKKGSQRWLVLDVVQCINHEGQLLHLHWHSTHPFSQ